eukprot:2917516-Rhodomonas_salina.1
MEGHSDNAVHEPWIGDVGQSQGMREPRVRKRVAEHTLGQYRTSHSTRVGYRVPGRLCPGPQGSFLRCESNAGRMRLECGESAVRSSALQRQVRREQRVERMWDGRSGG